MYNIIDIRFLPLAWEGFSREERQAAAAYLLQFEKSFSYYDDRNEEAYNSFFIKCTSENRSEPSCHAWDHTDKIFVRPDSGMKKNFESKFTGATNHELSRASIISDLLYAYLIEHGLSEDLFRPVFQKNGSRWAYFLDGRKNMIPSLTLEYNGAVGPFLCPACGRITWKANETLFDEISCQFNEASHSCISPVTFPYGNDIAFLR